MHRERDQVETDELDALLGAHLRSRLDPQLGRATDAFAEAAAGHANAAHRRGGGGGGGGGERIRLAVAWVGLVAALVTIAWLIWPSRDDRPTPVVVTNSPVTPRGTEPREIERMVMWETVDERPTIVGDHVPVRKLRQEGVEQVHYYDPDDRATIRVSVPLVRDVMVEMETY